MDQGFRKAERSTNNFIDSLQRTNPSIKGLAIGFLINGLVGLTAAAAPAVGIIATLPAFLLAAGQAGGILAIAIKGTGDAIKAAFDDSKKGAEKFKEELAKLPPPARAFVLTIKSLIPELRKLKAAVQGIILPQLSQSLRQLSRTYFPVFREGISATSEVVDDFLERLTRLVGSGPFARDIQNLLGSNARVFHSVGRAILSVLDALVSLMAVAAPYSEKLAELIARGAAFAQEFIKSARASGDLAEFMQRAYDVTLKLLSIIGHLSEAIIILVAQLQPVGDPFLNSIDKLSISLGNFFQALGGNTELLESLTGSVVLLLNALTALLNAFAALDPRVQGMLGHIISMAVTVFAISRAFDLAYGGVVKFRGSIDRMTDTIGKVGGYFASAGRGIATFIGFTAVGGKHAAAATGFFARFGAAVGRIGGFIAKILPFLARLAPLFARVGLAIAGVATGPIGITIAVIAALVAIFILAYKHSDRFREIVDKSFHAIQNVVSTVVNAVLGFIRQLVSAFQGGGFAGVIKFLFASILSTVANWGARLGALALSAGAAFLRNLLSFLQQLPQRIAFIIGFVIGRMIRFSVQMQIMAVKIAVAFVKNLGLAIIHMFQFGIRMQQLAAQLGVRVVTAIVVWLSKLPGRMQAFFLAAGAFLVRFAVTSAARARALGSAVLRGIVSFLQQLPGRVQAFFSRAIAVIQSAARRAPGVARSLATGAVSAIRSGLSALPGLVSGLFGRAVDAISGMASRAFARAKAIASSLWNGFKAGLGIKSPSFIEKAMFQITDVMDRETRRLSNQVRAVQRMSGGMPNIGLGFANMPAPRALGATGGVGATTLSFDFRGARFDKTSPEQIREAVGGSGLLRTITNAARSRRGG